MSSVRLETSLRGTEEGPFSNSAAFSILTSHVVNELQTIALYSLAWEDDVDEDVSSDEPELRRADNSTIGSSRRSSLSFDAEPGYPGWEGEPFFDHVHVSEAASEGLSEWSFIFSGHLGYVGHDDDPVLRTFVQKLQVEALLAEGKATDPKLPCKYLPVPQNPEFFGRNSILQRLEKVLRPHGHTRGGVRTFILHGPGGTDTRTSLTPSSGFIRTKSQNLLTTSTELPSSLV